MQGQRGLSTPCQQKPVLESYRSVVSGACLQWPSGLEERPMAVAPVWGLVSSRGQWDHRGGGSGLLVSDPKLHGVKGQARRKWSSGRAGGAKERDQVSRIILGAWLMSLSFVDPSISKAEVLAVCVCVRARALGPLGRPMKLTTHAQ